MDPINPWIDASEMRQLAERLMQPNPSRLEKSADTGFDDSFEGFAQAPSSNPVGSQQLVQAPAPASPSYIDPQPLAEIAPPVVAATAPAPTLTTPAASTPAPTDSLPVQVNASEQERPSTDLGNPQFLSTAKQFQQQLQAEHQADGIFILNRAGDTLFGSSTHTRLQFIAKNFIQLASRKGAPSGNVRIKIGPERVLEIISANTSGDGLIMGTIVPKVFAATDRMKISQQLDGMHN